MRKPQAHTRPRSHTLKPLEPEAIDFLLNTKMILAKSLWFIKWMVRSSSICILFNFVNHKLWLSLNYSNWKIYCIKNQRKVLVMIINCVYLLYILSMYTFYCQIISLGNIHSSDLCSELLNNKIYLRDSVRNSVQVTWGPSVH